MNTHIDSQSEKNTSAAFVAVKHTVFADRYTSTLVVGDKVKITLLLKKILEILRALHMHGI